jgi:hypothetical protein
MNVKTMFDRLIGRRHEIKIKVRNVEFSARMTFLGFLVIIAGVAYLIPFLQLG